MQNRRCLARARGPVDDVIEFCDLRRAGPDDVDQLLLDLGTWDVGRVGGRGAEAWMWSNDEFDVCFVVMRIYMLEESAYQSRLLTLGDLVVHLLMCTAPHSQASVMRCEDASHHPWFPLPNLVLVVYVEGIRRSDVQSNKASQSPHKKRCFALHKVLRINMHVMQ